MNIANDTVATPSPIPAVDRADSDAGDAGIASLAPAVVVRASRFPWSTLAGLADAALAGRAADEGPGATSPAFEAAYAETMLRQQQRLAAATVDDDSFMKALAITNDALGRRLAGDRSWVGSRGKRARQVQGTLYRHLARAAWRTEPCDLWAGVGIGRWGDRTAVARAVPGCAIAPDLGPYQALVQALAATDAYVARGVYKVNPTLALDGAGPLWRFTVRSGTLVHHESRPCSSALDALLQALAGLAPAPLASLAARLGPSADGPDPSLLEMLRALQASGLLVGGLAWPREVPSAWDALARVASDLLPAHARAWWFALRRLRRIVRRLESRIDTLSLHELLAAQDAVRALPAALAQALGQEAPAEPRATLRADVGLPFTLTLGPDLHDRLLQAARAFDRFEVHEGVDLAARTAHRHRLAGLGDAAEPPAPQAEALLTQEAAWQAGGADRTLGRRLARWSGWLAADAAALTVEADTTQPALVLPPVGALLVRLGRGCLQIAGSTPEVGPAYGRFGRLWYGPAQRQRHRFDDHPLHRWYVQALRQSADAAGVDAVEYVGPCEGLPNALARPDFGLRRWDRWGTTSTFAQDQVVTRLHVQRGVAVPLVDFAGSARPSALFCFAPVNLGFSEPELERLLLSSFRELPTWLPPGLPMRVELGRDTPTPALHLPGGARVRPRRLFVHGAELQALADAGPAQRFLWWQRLARRHRWPAIVLVARDGRRALPVVRDSPLAVEAALQGLRAGLRLLSIEEPDAQPWNVDPAVLDCCVELVVPHLRRRHAWSDLAAG